MSEQYRVGRAFGKKKPDCSHCPVRREREAKIAKVEGDIALLEKFKVPHPKADSELGTLKHFQGVCKDGRCHD